MGQEADVMANIRFKEGKRFGDWVIAKKLDEGGFGQVYMVQNLKTKKKAALKAESNEVEGGSAIKLEITILRDLNKNGPKPHIPEYHHAAKRGKYCYMIMTLLGSNLKELKGNNQTAKERFTRATWARIGIQCLYSLKYVHDNGYLHRDIKPNNFVMGAPDDTSRARIVHVLDFGLARAFAFQSEGKWRARLARGTAEFRGTLKYVSPNVHLRKEQGRQDDLWSLMFVIIEFNGGLPWQGEREKSKIEAMKLSMDDKSVVINMPSSMHGIIPHFRTLDCYQRPDYCLFYNGLVQVMKAEKATSLTPYDWETAEQVEAAKKYAKENGPDAWENADFFKTDPMGINGPPGSSTGSLIQQPTVKADSQMTKLESKTIKK